MIAVIERSRYSDSEFPFRVTFYSQLQADNYTFPCLTSMQQFAQLIKGDSVYKLEFFFLKTTGKVLLMCNNYV